MKIRIVMMQKDETMLLRPLILYHGQLVGYESLTIFDNGSTNPDVINTLREFKELGVELIDRFNTVEDFAQKGYIICEKIKHFDRESPADFYFPMDCDEFICSRVTKTTPRFDLASLEEVLRPHMTAPQVLRIGFGFDNDPRDPSAFFVKGRQKCFVTQGALTYLDLGFHRAVTTTGSDFVETGVGYLHFHNKPYKLLIEAARKKMIGRVKDFSPKTLIEYRESRQTGFHLVSELLLEDENAYFDYISMKYGKKRPVHFNVIDFIPAIGKDIGGSE